MPNFRSAVGQVVGQRLLDAFFCDGLFQMIEKTTSKNSAESPLFELADGLVEAAQVYPFLDVSWPDESTEFQEACQSIVSVCRSLLGLMVPEYNYKGITTEQTLYLMRLDERDEKLMATAAAAAEKPVGQAITFSKYWSEQLDFLAKHAASSEKLGPEVLDLISKLTGCAEEDHQVNDAFKITVKKFAMYQESFRPGGLRGLKEALISRVSKMVPAIMALQVSEFDATQVPIIEEALQICAGSNKTITDLRIRFSEWKESLASQLAMQRLVIFAQEASSNTGPFDWDELASHLDQVTDEALTSEAVQASMTLCLKIFEVIGNKA